MLLETGATLHGRYQIKQLLGQGGMGAVYKGFDTLYDRECAIKEFRLGHLPDEDTIRQQNARLPKGKQKPTQMSREKAERQFKREARLLASLDHCGLPKVTDYFSVAQDSYLVMTLIEGKDLFEWMEEKNWQPLPEQQVQGWIQQVSDALAYCHQQGVIHRDIKPSNIIVTAAGKVYLVDFGIAKDTTGSHGTSGMTQILTPRYSPPEQYTGQGKTDTRSDIYALGATMYTLLTGKEPLESIARATGTKMAEPRTLCQVISQNTNQTVMEAMQLDQDDRYQTVEEMQRALWSSQTPPAPSDADMDATLVMPEEPPPQLPAYLRLISTSRESTLDQDIFPLTQEVFQIGRMGKRKDTQIDMDLTEMDAKRIISHHHASIEYKAGCYILKDLSSRNGTWLNGEKLAPQQEKILSDHDTIQFGSIKPRGVHMTFHLKNA